jgi:hypothetical protein
MLKRLLSGLAVSTLVGGACFAFSETSVPASQHAITQALSPVPGTPPVTLQNQSDPSVGHQMLAFEHRARVDMILYTGAFGQGQWTAPRIDAVALSLKAGSR